jgi:branched-chain amino acid transport system permease protein
MSAAVYGWRWRALILALGALDVMLLPRVLDDFSDAHALDLALVAIFFIALLGLSILTGHTGQISLGHGAFMALGAYTTAILVSDQGLNLAGHTFSSDLRDLSTIPIAGLVAGLAGFLFGLPALRIRGLYLALATFAVAVALPPVLRRFDTLTGGGGGINLFGLPGHTGGVGGVEVFGRDLTWNEYVYYLSWAIAGALLVVGWAIVRGRTGRAFRALLYSETAAASFGVDPARYKTLAFAISAAYAGIAGSLLAIHTTFVNPDVFPVTLSMTLLVGLVVGGLGSLAPLVAGAFFVVYVRTLAEDAGGRGWLPDALERFLAGAGGRDVLFAGVLIAVAIMLPSGVGGLVRRLLQPLTDRLYTRSARGPGTAARDGTTT